MSARKQAKTRTNKNRQKTKVKISSWVVALLILVVVGTGIFLVYNSYAFRPDGGSRPLPNYPSPVDAYPPAPSTGGLDNNSSTIWCKQGNCYAHYVEGARANSRNNCSYNRWKNNWLCP